MDSIFQKMKDGTLLDCSYEAILKNYSRPGIPAETAEKQARQQIVDWYGSWDRYEKIKRRDNLECNRKARGQHRMTNFDRAAEALRKKYEEIILEPDTADPDIMGRVRHDTKYLMDKYNYSRPEAKKLACQFLAANGSPLNNLSPTEIVDKIVEAGFDLEDYQKKMLVNDLFAGIDIHTTIAAIKEYEIEELDPIPIMGELTDAELNEYEQLDADSQEAVYKELQQPAEFTQDDEDYLAIMSPEQLQDFKDFRAVEKHNPDNNGKSTFWTAEKFCQIYNIKEANDNDGEQQESDQQEEE
jgi:hypothetical protein